MADTLTARQMLSKLTFDLLRKQPFFGEVIIRLRDACEVSSGTAYATAERIGYNPDFIEMLDQAEANFVFMHELCHVIWQHAGRRNNRDTVIWNVAADLVVNAFLTDSITDFAKVGIRLRAPSSVLDARDFPVVRDDINSLTVEQVYNRLAEINPEHKGSSEPMQTLPGEKGSSESPSNSQNGESSEPQNPDSSKNSPGSSDQNSQDQENSDGTAINTSEYGRTKSIPKELMDLAREEGRPESDVQARDTVRRVVTEVQTHSKFHGNGHGNLEQELENLNGTKIPWYRYVRRYLTSKEDSEESYDTPNKNFLWKRQIVPGPVGSEDSKLTDIIVGVDTSGSVFYDKPMLEDFFYQVSTLIKDFELEGRVVTWDTEVGDDIEISDSKDFARSLRRVCGGGGTDISCLLKYVKETYRNRYTALIVLTDGYFSTPGMKRLRDTLLVIPKDQNTEWSSLGRVVML